MTNSSSGRRPARPNSTRGGATGANGSTSVDGADHANGTTSPRIRVNPKGPAGAKGTATRPTSTTPPEVIPLRGASGKAEDRRARRAATLEARAQRERRARRNRLIVIGAIVLVLLAAIAAFGYWYFTIPPVSGPPIQSFSIQGRTHIAHDAPHPPYNSAPPTSGWHYADAVAPWGVSQEPIPDEIQVHNLEHGGIVVQYDCPDGCPEIKNQLEAIGRSYRSKVLVAPYKGIPGHPIAVTAWGRLAYLDSVDEAFIRRFIDKYKNQAPEQVPDT